jgi:hypothetical protein
MSFRDHIPSLELARRMFPRFGSKPLSDQFSAFLERQTDIFRHAVDRDLGDRGDDLRPLVYATGQTARTISSLAKDDLLNEAMMLARSFLERSINLGYLLFCDEEELDRYKKHALQKAYRRLDRSESVGEKSVRLTYSGDIDPKDIPELQEALDLFTSKRGREITWWTSKKLDERIQIIEERGGASAELFLVTWLSVYEDASEALHGSLIGITFHTGVWEPGNSPDDRKEIDKHVLKNLTLLCWQCGLILHLLLQLLNHDNALENLIHVSKQNVDRTKSMMQRAMQGS